TDTKRSDCQTSSASCLSRNAVKNRTLTTISTRVATVRRLPSGRNVTLCSPIGDPWRKARKRKSRGAAAQARTDRNGPNSGLAAVAVASPRNRRRVRSSASLGEKIREETLDGVPEPDGAVARVAH